MMICNFCKKTIVDDAVFCSYCGRKLLKKEKTDDSKVYYKLFREYLNELVPAGVDIGHYFNPQKKTSMNEVVYQFALNLQDYNMMPGVIGFLREERKPVFEHIFFGYSCDKILASYSTDTLFETFCVNFPVKNKESKQNSWLKYARGIIDACTYLNKFEDVQQFNDYIEGYKGSLDIIKEMQSRIYGMGFALACNMVKDLGFTSYAKPDTHTTDVIVATGLSEQDDNVSVIRAIQNIAIANNDSAFNVDRMIWLICSGYYFFDDVRVKPRKKELLGKIYALKIK